MSGAFFYLWAFTLLIIDSVFPSQEKQSLGPYTNDSTIKNTRFGWVKGTLLPTKSDSVRGVLQFLNIPYAEPPVAELRYSDPVDWTAPYPRPYYNATRVGVQCRQQQYSGKRSFLTVGVEDCLYLNIWTPYLRNKSDVSFNFTDTNSTTALPVLFFIHGGDFIEGNGDQYNGSVLAAKHKAVVVTTNYRLGHLGWLQPVPEQANFGLKDQRSALRYVHNNIIAFGGDPNEVMIFGESAGGTSVALHLMSPASDGLFSTAILESAYPSVQNKAFALQVSDVFSKAAHCNITAKDQAFDTRLACLRNASLDDLDKAAAAATTMPPGTLPLAQIGWGPTVDGKKEGLHDDIFIILSSGDINGGDASVLAGTNTNEGSEFVYPYYPDGLDTKEYRALVNSMLIRSGRTANKSIIERVLNQYPANSTISEDKSALASSCFTDYFFRCFNRLLLKRATFGNNNVTHTFAYRFDIRAKADSSPTDWGVEHGAEVPFVFDQGSWIGAAGFTPAEERVAESMGTSWVNFARDRNPSVNSDYLWPPFQSNGSQPMELCYSINSSRPEPFTSNEICNFWETIYDTFTQI